MFKKIYDKKNDNILTVVDGRRWRARASRFTDENEGGKVVVVSAVHGGERGGAWVSCGGSRELKLSRNVGN